MGLVPMLKSLGIDKIFGIGDLNGFTENNDLYVSDVIDKATIEGIILYRMTETHKNLLAAEFDFSLGVANQLSPSESTIFSPLSISIALSLVHSGAKGATREEIEKILLKGASNELYTQHFSNLMTSLLKKNDGVELQLANKVYIRNTFSLLESYLSFVKKNYSAVAESLNFADGKKTAETINDFVKKTTKGKIDGIVEAGMFGDAMLKCVLVNAVYMKGEWLHKFKKEATTPGTFYVAQNKKKEVVYLNDMKVNRGYFENKMCQVLSLEYKDKRYRFNIFLPRERYGLETLQKELNGTKMQEILTAALSSALLNITIPKFKLESEMGLIPLLKSLGIREIFSTGDLSGFTGTKDLYVSEVKHKAMIELDAEGTVAAAVTYGAVRLSACSYPNEPVPIVFLADHPFMFCITFEGHPIFVGKYI